MKVSRYLHGQPCWAELATHNWQSARAFYSALLGWGMADMALPGGAFSMFTVEGDELGAMYQLPEGSSDINTHWKVYFSVDSVNDVITSITQVGGELLFGPHAVGDAGYMAQLRDPEGSVFAIWQSKNHIGAKRTQEVGTLCWVELACRDAKKAKGFYHQLLGWCSRQSQMPDFDYTEWLVDDEAFGGMLEMTAEWGDMPAHWMLYFTVNDCDAVTDKVEGLGGTVCVPPTNIPKVGRFAVINDPEGGVFSIIALTAPN